MTLAELNAADRAGFVAALGEIFEHSPWVAERAFDDRPFASVGALHAAMVAAMRAAAESEQLALIRAHPELAGRAMVRAELTADSTREQSGAGLTQCSPDELAQLRSLNARYNEKFGFPFILAVKGLDARRDHRRVRAARGARPRDRIRRVSRRDRQHRRASGSTH